ncbi:MAG TPA: serine--tRNA ligase, partial [Patescibacteria group bacterium]
MLDINLIRNNPDLVKTSLINRQKDSSVVDQILETDKNYRNLLSQVESLRSNQNALSRTIKGKPSEEQLKQGAAIKAELKNLEENLKKVEDEQKTLVETIPNIAADDVPVGKDDADNVVFKTVGTKPEFTFQLKDHIDLCEALDIIDVKKAGVISGSRFGYFKGKGAQLEMAVMFYAFNKLIQKGFVGMVPPAMIKSETEWKCGYASNKNLFNAYYSSPEDDLIFISSSEHAVVPYHMDEIIDEKRFPLKYVNFSPCFRREAGTYGKDTRGMFRVHFFNKVEMNIFTLPDLKTSDDMNLEMLSIEEEIMQELGLHYQVVKNCTGDLPQPNRRMYDINTWFP